MRYSVFSLIILLSGLSCAQLIHYSSGNGTQGAASVKYVHYTTPTTLISNSLLPDPLNVNRINANFVNTSILSVDQIVSSGNLIAYGGNVGFSPEDGEINANNYYGSVSGIYSNTVFSIVSVHNKSVNILFGADSNATRYIVLSQYPLFTNPLRGLVFSASDIGEAQIIPTMDDFYRLGISTYRWKGYFSEITADDITSTGLNKTIEDYIGNIPPPGGDITSVIAGTCLTGGATSGAATLNANTSCLEPKVTEGSLANDVIVSADIKNNSITSTDVLDNTLTAADIVADAIGDSELAENARITGSFQAATLNTTTLTNTPKINAPGDLLATSVGDMNFTPQASDFRIIEDNGSLTVHYQSSGANSISRKWEQGSSLRLIEWYSHPIIYWLNGTSTGLFNINVQTGNFLPGVNKNQDFGAAATSWDTCYCDDHTTTSRGYKKPSNKADKTYFDMINTLETDQNTGEINHIKQDPSFRDDYGNVNTTSLNAVIMAQNEAIKELNARIHALEKKRAINDTG